MSNYCPTVKITENGKVADVSGDPWKIGYSLKLQCDLGYMLNFIDDTSLTAECTANSSTMGVFNPDIPDDVMCVGE